MVMSARLNALNLRVLKLEAHRDAVNRFAEETVDAVNDLTKMVRAITKSKKKK
jgi:hypothetical protein